MVITLADSLKFNADVVELRYTFDLKSNEP